MANTTNFNWETPDDTDLVKDGAAAIRTLGSSIDTSLVDLKGGTTGQVLSKATNTDMDFTWVAQDDSNAIQNAIVDAKGDLVAATANDTPARLAVGTNGQVLTADSTAATGLAWASSSGEYAAGKNKIINGDFGVWQRGTSFTNPADGTYIVDRWVVDSGGGTNSTITRQTTGAPKGTRYIARIAQTGTANKTIAQLLETSTSAFLWGQTVVASVYLRRNATQTGDLGLTVYKSATTDASRGATWTSIGSVSATNANLPTGTTSADWYRASVSFSVPNDGTANSIKLTVGDVSNNPNGAYWEISNVQLEIGSTATSFQSATGTIQGELAACQRYYYRTTADASNTSAKFGNGSPQSATTGYASVVNPVPLRVPATSIDFANLAYINFGLSTFAASGLVLAGGSQSPTMSFFQFTSSGMTAGQFGWIQSNSSSSGYIGFSAEL